MAGGPTANGNAAPGNGAGAVQHRPAVKRARKTTSHHADYDGHLGKPRNFGSVRFATWVITPWYHSPYPIVERQARAPTPDVQVTPSGRLLPATAILPNNGKDKSESSNSAAVVAVNSPATSNSVEPKAPPSSRSAPSSVAMSRKAGGSSGSTVSANEEHRRASRSRTRRDAEENAASCVNYAGPYTGTRSRSQHGSDSPLSSRNTSRTRAADDSEQRTRKRLFSDDMVQSDHPRGRSQRRRPLPSMTETVVPDENGNVGAPRPTEAETRPTVRRSKSQRGAPAPVEPELAKKPWTRPPTIGRNELAALSEDFLNERKSAIGTTQEMTAVAEAGSSDRKLWVCDKCFKYMQTLPSYQAHIATCDIDRPPGKLVYDGDPWRIWEVDGKSQAVGALSFGRSSTQTDRAMSVVLPVSELVWKIVHRSQDHFLRRERNSTVLMTAIRSETDLVLLQTENFLFYVLTESSSKREHPIGYFSKEKVSFEDYNLATIAIFPPFQHQRYGHALVEFSYHLTKGQSSPGTPERPLSKLGALSYEAFWTRIILRHLLEMLIAQGTDEGDPWRLAWNHKVEDVKWPIRSSDFPATPPPARDFAINFNTFVKNVHIQQEDVLLALQKLGFLDNHPDDTNQREIRVSLDLVLKACELWKVYACGMIRQDAIDRAAWR